MHVGLTDADAEYDWKNLPTNLVWSSLLSTACHPGIYCVMIASRTFYFLGSILFIVSEKDGKGWKRMEKELKSTYEELHPEAIPLAAQDRNEGTVNYILIHFRPPACGDYFGSFLDLTCRLWTVDCGRLRCLVLPSWQETESPVTASLMFEV